LDAPEVVEGVLGVEIEAGSVESVFDRGGPRFLGALVNASFVVDVSAGLALDALGGVTCWYLEVLGRRARRLAGWVVRGRLAAGGRRMVAIIGRS